MYNLLFLTKKTKSLIIPDEILEIISFHRRFSSKLLLIINQSSSNPNFSSSIVVSICKLFLENIGNFQRLYCKYPLIVEISKRTILTLKSKNRNFEKFLAKKLQLSICQGMTLINFLALPLPKISYYFSFITRLIKTYPNSTTPGGASSPGIKGITGSLKGLNTIRSQGSIGRTKVMDRLLEKFTIVFQKERENIEKIDNKYKCQQIVDKLKIPNLYSEGTRLIKEGNLKLAPTKEITDLKKKIIGKGFGSFDMKKNISDVFGAVKGSIETALEKKAGDVVNELMNTRITDILVYVYLFNDRIVIQYTNKFFKIMKNTHQVMLKNIKSITNEKNKFTIQLKKKQYSFTANSNEDSHIWVTKIQEAVDVMEDKKKGKELSDVK